MATAVQLAQTELASSLFTATQQLSSVELADFLVMWRAQLVHELSQDPHHVLGRKCPVLASQIPAAFPEANILRFYAFPCTSRTSSVGNEPKRSDWANVEPNLEQLGALCEKYFSWGTSRQLIQRFQSYVWPGTCIRYLMKVHKIIDVSMVLFLFLI